jgi:hypothetical protein
MEELSPLLKAIGSNMSACVSFLTPALALNADLALLSGLGSYLYSMIKGHPCC